jgi:class 3 adenylate cyclase
MLSDAESPFPLRRAFLAGVLPGLLLLIGTVVFATAQTVRSATTEVLLQLASAKVDGIAKGIAAAAPTAWQEVLSGRPLSPAGLAEVRKALADEQRETQVMLLKIYAPDRRSLFATDGAEIGLIEDNPALINALGEGSSSVAVETDGHGNNSYELYIPYRAGDTRVAAVFELYEPIAGFDALLWKVVQPVLVIPIGLFAATLVALTWLVWRAQADIDRRTSTIVSLRQRLERLVSHSAVAAMRAGDAELPKAEIIEVALLHSDVRGFTSFAEDRPPSEVVDFLNRIIGLQVDIIEANGGDVDKMIGDAVLARFHGAGNAARAVDTAKAIQTAVRLSGLPLGIGIGVFAGPVMAGLIGSGNRFDYTVIGDSVNIAARLCEAAREGEIVVDGNIAALAENPAFGPEETLRVKGRAGALKVRRLSIDRAMPAERIGGARAATSRNSSARS